MDKYSEGKGDKMIIIKNKEEMEQYYNERTNTYEFMACGDAIDVEFLFNVDVKRDINAKNIKALNIKALNINARDIKALNINALNIKAWDIKASNISYYAVCFACKNIYCTSIIGRRHNARHFCLDGEITIKPKTYTITLDGKEIELSE